MRLFAVILLFLTLSSLTLAQSAQKIIYFSGDPRCGYKSPGIKDTDELHCTVIDTERGKISAITYNGINLTVALLEDNDHLMVGAKISNLRTETISFDSDLWGAAHFKTRASFFAAEKPVVAETSLPSRELVRHAAAGQSVNNAVDNMMSDTQKVANAVTVELPDGTQQRRVRVEPDPNATDVAQQNRAARELSTRDKQERLRETALTAKSVPANGSVKGLVYFNRVKNAGFVLFTISVDGTYFMFMWPRKVS